jgi:hypothetical protein
MVSCLHIAKRVGHSNYDRFLVDETYTKVHVWRELGNKQEFRLHGGLAIAQDRGFSPRGTCIGLQLPGRRTPVAGLLFRHRPRHLFRRLPACHRLRDDQLPRLHPDLRQLHGKPPRSRQRSQAADCNRQPSA